MNAREYCIKSAEKCVCSDRNETYGGEPENSFGVIAKLWDTYLGDRLLRDSEDQQIYDSDVAMMMALLKIGRIITGNFHEDNYIDLAGYAACALECAASAEGIRYLDEKC